MENKMREMVVNMWGIRRKTTKWYFCFPQKFAKNANQHIQMRFIWNIKWGEMGIYEREYAKLLSIKKKKKIICPGNELNY